MSEANQPSASTAEFGKKYVIEAMTARGFQVRSADKRPAIYLIAEKADEKYIIRVISRKFGLRENKGVLVTPKQIAALCALSNELGMTTQFAHVLQVPDDKIIHLVRMPSASVPSVLRQVERGYRKDISELMHDASVDYRSWPEERPVTAGNVAKDVTVFGDYSPAINGGASTGFP